MPEVQLFGRAKSQTTRKAQRFFKERRVPFHYVDLDIRAPSPGELRRWVQRFGIDGVLDPESRAYVDQGLRYVSASDDDWITRIIRDPTVLRLPLVRCGTALAVGDDPAAWHRFADAAKATRRP